MMKVMGVVLLLALAVPAFAFELATTITKRDGSTKLESSGYAKVNLLQQVISVQGSIVVTGTLNVTGAANVVMW